MDTAAGSPMEGSHPVLEPLVESAPVGLGLWDADLRYRLVNARLAEINGIPVDEHLGRTPGELLGEIGHDGELALRQVLDTGSPIVEMAFRGETPAHPGQPRDFLASLFPVGEDAVGGVVLDVTDRAEAARREHEARSRAEALVRASSALASSMRPERVLAALVRAVVPSLADFCAVHLIAPGGRLDAIAVSTADPADEELARRLAERQAADPTARIGPAAV